MRLTGRRIVGGHADGSVLAAAQPLSFLGGVDADSGLVMDFDSGIRGERVADRVLAFPRARGSTVGSYVLYGLRRRNISPSAIVAGNAETILAVGAVIADVPTVDGISVDLLRTGDRALVDANTGSVDLPDVRERPVVSCFLEREGRVLVVRRSNKVGSFQGKWSGISGFLEGSEDSESRARREIEEETGLTEVTLLGRGEPVLSRGGDTVYRIHPFRFDAPHGTVRLDWENVEYRWIDPREIPGLDGVPKLAAAFSSAARGS